MVNRLAHSSSRCQIRTATLADLGALAHLLTAGFYQNQGWGRLVYPLIRLGIQEDLKTRFNGHNAHYACLTAFCSPTSTPPSPSPAPSTVSKSNPHPTTQPKPHQLVGTVEISCRPTYIWFLNQPQYLYLSNLAVDAQFRRRGIAQQLLQTCETLAIEWGFRDLYLHVMEDNEQARRLYRKAGYRLQSAEWSLPSSLLGQPKRLLLRKTLSQKRQGP